MLNKLNQITNAQTLQLQHAAAQSAAGQKPAQEEFDSILKRELKNQEDAVFKACNAPSSGTRHCSDRECHA